MWVKKTLHIEQAAIVSGVDKDFITHCIKNEWIHPYQTESLQLDDEDIARVRLINNLLNDFEVNNHAIPIILSLIDQLHHFLKKVPPDMHD